MNFYPFHIGDYISNTGHLEPLEDLAYRRMIDLYYLRETVLPLEIPEIAKLIRMRESVEIVSTVLREFFKESDCGWFHSRCDYEISESKSKRSKAKESAAKRWQSDGKAMAKRTHSEGNATNTNTNTKGKHKGVFVYPEEFEVAWKAYPSRPGASKKDAFKAWSARISAGISPKVLIDGAVRYSKYCDLSETEPKYIKQPETFFGPSDFFLADWTVKNKANPDIFTGVE